MEEAAAADLTWPHEGLKLFCNFSCDDMVPENGSTECWLGSHQETAAAQARNAGPDSPEILTLDQLAEIRRQTDPPVQITVPKGAVAFRDRPGIGPNPNQMLLPQGLWSEAVDDVHLPVVRKALPGNSARQGEQPVAPNLP